MARKLSFWRTRFGFYLAAIGSAFGLGNLWRFPYVVVENGGGAFVLLYTFLALLIGLPLLVGELMLGKTTRRSTTGAVRRVLFDPQFAQKLNMNPILRYLLRWVGRLAVLSSFFVLSYYAVISGWVLHFLMQFAIGQIHSQAFDPEKALLVLRDTGWLQIALASVHLLFTIVIVVKGVREGIERWVGAVMPIFAILLLLLVFRSLSLPSAASALRFLFYPDFSKLTYSSLAHAIGHVCFTLSIGFGTMVTFGSYLSEETKIPSAGFRVTAVDTVISLLAGLLIFPIVISAALAVSGPDLLFQTLPHLFLQLDGGSWFGVAFFLCLYLAALGASIGLLEGIVSNLLDRNRLTRSQAAWRAGGVAFFLAVIPALSTSALKHFSFHGRGILETLDGVLINGILPLTALGISLLVSHALRLDLKRKEFMLEDSPGTEQLFSHWIFVLRWVAPLLIGGALLLQFIDFLIT